MIADGERLKELVTGAQKAVLLCAPFIKVDALRTVLSVINDDVPVRIITRWRAAEVASGVSDLEVFELSNERPRTELALLDDLHAKLYMADDSGLAGSANLTGAALGWAKRSNVELLLPITQSNPNVARLLLRLQNAEPATYAIRTSIEAEAATLNFERLDEGLDFRDNIGVDPNFVWLPCCAAPASLRTIYENSHTTAVVKDTREDGLADLRDLHIPAGLTPASFIVAVQDTLLLMPAFERIIGQIPQGLNDAAGIALISELRPDLNQTSAKHQWRIVRDWISVFFQDKFEVAPESFVTRLKAR